MGAAQDTYTAMLRDQVAPTLRRQGWKGSTGRFALPNPTHHLLLGFQGSVSSSSVDMKFTVNLATIDKAAWEANSMYWGKPSANAQGRIGVHHRLGQVMPQGQDTWWWVRVGDDTAPLAELLCAAIDEHGIPALLAARAQPEASTPWLELDRVARGDGSG